MKLLKSFMIANLILISGVSQAQTRYWNHHGYYQNRSEWVAPFVIGSALTYAITRPPIIIMPNNPDIYVGHSDIYHPSVPYGYHYENILDANCNCYRLVLVQNQP